MSCLDTVLVGLWAKLIESLEDLEFAIDGVDRDVPELGTVLCCEDSL